MQRGSQTFFSETRRSLIRFLATLAIGAAVFVGLGVSGRSDSQGYAAAAPASPPVQICGNTSLLSGPRSAPAGAVTIPAGNDDPKWDKSYSLAANTTYYLAAGTHTFGTAEFGEIQPAAGDTFVGAPGAIMNGQNDNQSAFDSSATDVTIEYLTIEDYVGATGQGVVNHDLGANWTIEYNTIEDNGGAGIYLGNNSVVTENCVTNNAELGIGSDSATNVTVTDNEVSFNDTTGQYDQPGDPNQCGCSGGIKFWRVTGAVVTGNYVHDNGYVGIWVDTDNSGFDISDNYIGNNWAEAIIYEISYNALISDNTIINNTWGKGVELGIGFPATALYVSESGGDSRVPGPYSGTFTVTGNVFTDNWGGVIIYENSNRACGLSNDKYCTLVDPSVYTLTTCAANLPTATPSGNPDYFDNCRWKSQNVSVTDNAFNFTPANIPQCTAAVGCGFNGLFSEDGSDAPYKGYVVPNNISNSQNNHFSDNTYNGPWSFMAFAQGDVVTQAQWTGGFVSPNIASDSFGAQDAGSTFHT